jgi:16S rRNA (cytidine1402-2'-O)-methyltransferase
VLILAATPIGNIADASDRLRSTLQEASAIACEDTRMLRQLAQVLGLEVRAKLFSLHEHNEREKLDHLLKIAEQGDLVVVSDAGMPTISDPGFALVREAALRDIEITIVPGASAVVAALAISGLPTDQFSFFGFLPRKSGERKAMFDAVRKHRGTLIFFESPHRIHDALEDAAEVLGERHSVVAREITKKFEQVVRGRLSELVQWAEQEPKGEIVLLIEGAADEGFDYQQLATKALDLQQRGLSLKDACATISELVGGSKKEIYDHALKLRA